jgi:aerobic carbon-monoxide dehydrogenase medium subunit
MYPTSFDYHAPSTLAEALALMEQYQDDAKVLAGSMSLVPLLKLRLASPKHLIDLRRLPGMSGIWESGSTLQIGAMTTHHDIATSALIKSKLPMMAEAAAQIGDAQIRNRGTIGGSLAHADPSADWPAVTMALDATVHLVGKKGERALKVEQFITGTLTSALEPGELVAQVRVPVPGKHTGAAYEKLPHPASRFAIVGVAALLTVDGGKIASARVAVTGIGAKAARSAAVERAVTGAADQKAVDAAAAHVIDGLDLRADATGSADYKAQLAKVTARKALHEAARRAFGPG